MSLSFPHFSLFHLNFNCTLFIFITHFLPKDLSFNFVRIPLSLNKSGEAVCLCRQSLWLVWPDHPYISSVLCLRPSFNHSVYPSETACFSPITRFTSPSFISTHSLFLHREVSLSLSLSLPPSPLSTLLWSSVEHSPALPCVCSDLPWQEVPDITNYNVRSRLRNMLLRATNCKCEKVRRSTGPIH